MHRAPPAFLALALLAGCDTLADADEFLNGREPNCEERKPFYPDADGDGLGEPTSVFIGCEPPPGYVEEVYEGDTGGDTGGE